MGERDLESVKIDDGLGKRAIDDDGGGGVRVAVPYPCFAAGVDLSQDKGGRIPCKRSIRFGCVGRNGESAGRNTLDGSIRHRRGS